VHQQAELSWSAGILEGRNCRCDGCVQLIAGWTASPCPDWDRSVTQIRYGSACVTLNPRKPAGSGMRARWYGLHYRLQFLLRELHLLRGRLRRLRRLLCLLLRRLRHLLRLLHL
jgi:hypothetical protein